MQWTESNNKQQKLVMGNNTSAKSVVKPLNEGHDRTLAIVPSVHTALVNAGVNVAKLIGTHKSALAAGLVVKAGKVTRGGKDAVSYGFKGEARDIPDSALSDAQDEALRFAVWHDAVRSIFTKKVNGEECGEFDFSPSTVILTRLQRVFPLEKKQKKEESSVNVSTPAETVATS